MIPIALTIQGLYSYQERQTIDFKNLTGSGLFGIFGSVGSGKSSVLEAISFALYGETERLNMRDKRAYNMMNLKSNSSYIEFDFVSHENKRFRIIRDFRRNSKKFDDVKPFSVTFYEHVNEKWIPLEHSDAEQIIGLSYANFKRTIIIPQGQFKEFLELGAAERTNMMKEIFNLHRFDLQNNVSVLSVKNKTELDQLHGELKGFEEVTEVQITTQRGILEAEQQKFDKVKKEHQHISEKYQQLKSLKADYESLQQKKENFQKLSSEKSGMDELEKRAILYDTVFRAFNPLLIEKEKLTKEISSRQKEKADQSRIAEDIASAFNKVKEQLNIIQPQFESLSQSKIQENDLSLILQMLKFSDEIRILKERTEKGSEKVDEVFQKQNNIQKKIEELTRQADTLKIQRIEADLLISIGSWFVQQKNLLAQHQKQTRKLVEQKEIIDQIRKELKSFEINPETFKEDFLVQSDVLEAHKKTLLQKSDQLKVQKELSRFASELHDGESCPLCGSTEHPHTVEFHDVDHEITTIQKQIQDVENSLLKIQHQIAGIEKILDRKKIFEDQLQSEQAISYQLQKELKAHLNNFTWKGFDANNEEDFELKRQHSQMTEKHIDQISQQISQERKNFEREQESLEKYKKALEEFRLEEAKKEEQISMNHLNIKVLDWNNYKESLYIEVEAQYQKLAEANLGTETEYQKLTQQEKELAPQLAEKRAIVTQLTTRISELEEEITSNSQDLDKALLQQEFASLTAVRDILSREINIHEVRSQIQQFRIEFETLRNGIRELEIKLEGSSFNREQFDFTAEQLKTAETSLQEANKAVAKAISEIERLEKEFNKKEDLLKKLTALQKRSENLKLMTNLFKASGFVQYVSSIYLRQLCDHANVRFHRMTKNQLSLQLNENNDFEIIDYLNEGKSRSVKTLSGGQAFQVSLSLALALAESVQATTKADKNFFFIDEGFGTQDLESVNIVFETLMGLLKENRIVGIISHVEELKERIPVSLSIIKDEERGSLIGMI